MPDTTPMMDRVAPNSLSVLTLSSLLSRFALLLRPWEPRSWPRSDRPDLRQPVVVHGGDAVVAVAEPLTVVPQRNAVDADGEG